MIFNLLLFIFCLFFSSDTFSKVDYPRLCAPYYSQCGQDKYVHEVLFRKNKRYGFFFDIGAHDGMSYSNTYFFEKEMEWAGICVEPHPEIFKELKKNRCCICMQGCIFDKEGEFDFAKVNGCPEMLSGLTDTFDDAHQKRVVDEIKTRGGSQEIVRVKCFKFNNICAQYGIKHIDFLSVDTEGSEESIIKSIDFNKIDIDVIAVENNNNDKKIMQHLNQKGYKRIASKGGDDIYRKKK